MVVFVYYHVFCTALVDDIGCGAYIYLYVCYDVDL